MEPCEESDVTRLLLHAREGDARAEGKIFEIVYGELRAAAAAALRVRRGDSVLQPTAIVHEAWIKLTGRLDAVEGRRHFFSLAAKAMRQVIADHARAARREKRGGEARTILLTSDVAGDAAESGRIDLLDLHDALERLGALNERHVNVVEMRLLGAMSTQDIADILEVSKRTVESDWSMARAWLTRELR